MDKKEWINVKDRLPKQGVKVLTSNRGGWFLILQYDSYYESWTDDDYNTGVDYWLKSREYWMPLPEKPTP